MTSQPREDSKPLCTSCNEELSASLTYCVKCGTRQKPREEPSEAPSEATTGLGVVQEEAEAKGSVFCPVCRAESEPGASSCFRCGTAFYEADLNRAVQPAEFFNRAIAFVLDLIFLTLISVGVGVALFFLFSRISADPTLGFLSAILLFGPQFLVLSFLYEALTTKLYGGTPGKRLLGLRVVDDSGNDLGWGASVARAFLKILLNFIIFFIFTVISLIMVIGREDKRSAHDLIISSSVTDKKRTIEPLSRRV